jgi:hypothetical protein
MLCLIGLLECHPELAEVTLVKNRCAKSVPGFLLYFFFEQILEGVENEISEVDDSYGSCNCNFGLLRDKATQGCVLDTKTG